MLQSPLWQVYALAERVVVYALLESKSRMLDLPAACNDKPQSAPLEVRDVCDIFVRENTRQVHHCISTSIARWVTSTLLTVSVRLLP